MQAQGSHHGVQLSARERIWWVRIGAATLVAVLLSLSAPLIWSAVSAGVGLAALAALAAAGTVATAAIPLGLQRLENHLLRLRKAEARRNPIEQLQNEMMRRAERLQVFRRALVTVGTQIESIRDMIAKSQTGDRNPVLVRQELALQRLEQFHAINLERLNQAQRALHEFRSTVVQKQREWEIALAIDDANRALDPHAGDNLLQDLLADTALRAVQDRFNSVFAELDVQLNSMDAPTRNLMSPSGAYHMDALSLPAVQSRR